MPNPTVASVDAATISQRFNWDWAVNQDSFTGADTYWWWCVSVRVDPNEVWAEDDEGDLWVVPFSTDGADSVTFGEPVRSRLTAVPVSAQAGVLATATANRRSQRTLAEFEKPDKPAREGENTAAEARPNPEEANMDENVQKALEHLGYDAEDPTPEQVAQAEALTGAGWQPTDPEPGAPAPVVEVEPETEPTTEPVPVAAEAKPGTVTVDTATWEETQRNAKAGAELAAETRTKEDRDAIASALREGRIPLSRKAHYEAAQKVDREGTNRLLTASVEEGGLAPGLVPVEEIGTSASADDAAASIAPGEDGLLPTGVSLLTPAQRAARAGS